jgi:digeranylgeranylglycerophospholipid reductase
VVLLSFDIAIVGGSFAGLSAAREVSQKCDARIVIIEEHPAIGEPAPSSAFTFVDTVNQYGLDVAVARYYSRVGHYSYLGSTAFFELGGPKLAALDCTRACREMLKKSKKANMEILSGTRATGVARKNGKISINIAGRAENPISCNLLIDASGASFFSARFFPFRIPCFYSHPYGFELENCEIPEDFLDQMSLFVGTRVGSGGGWFYPITRTRCRFGVAEITRTPDFPVDLLVKYYDFAKQNMRPFSRMIVKAEPCSMEAGTIPAEPMKRLVFDNVMRVGDSAGHATPHFLEGVRPALDFGRLCGSVAAEAYQKRDYTKSFLQKYERLWHKRNKLSYLYLLSSGEVFFSYDDDGIEKTVTRSARARLSSESYLASLKGEKAFPYALIASKPSLDYLRKFVRFVANDLRWSLE